MKIKYFNFWLPLFFCVFNWSVPEAKIHQTSYQYRPEVPADVWVQLEPYFLPQDHPLKTKLDRIFKKRATASVHRFEKAGFAKVKLRESTNIIIGYHLDLDGYIVKAYLDTQPPLCEWCNWLKRIEGAHAIRDCIARHKFRDCVVPQKWIYPLPITPSADRSANFQKNFILIVEDMQILSWADNLKAFKKKMNARLLKEIYTIIKEEGLIDSVYPDNIPFTRHGQIAFIDTEHFHQEPVDFNVLSHYLSPKMKSFWNALIKQ